MGLEFLRYIEPDEHYRETLPTMTNKHEAPGAESVSSKYLRRELLEIPHSTSEPEGCRKFKIMSYNMLAQSLAKRELFPTSGPFLRWKYRSVALLDELTYYDCDIMCFQEVDSDRYEGFWSSNLASRGYASYFHRWGEKRHGVAVFYKKSMFVKLEVLHIDFDEEDTGSVKARTDTRNVGVLIGFSLADDPLRVIIVGTAHLFWHPFGTFERTRQTYIVLKKTAEFEDKLKEHNPSLTHVWKLFTGDFNSQPFDAPYLSITSKPTKYTSRCRTVILCSTSYDFSAERSGASVDQPETPVPDTFQPTEEQESLVSDIENLHNALPYRAVSLYSLAYGEVHPDNAGINNNRNEPSFSNWAHTWKGLLDYVFLIKNWDLHEDCTQVDSLESFEQENKVRLFKLLKLPHPDEMDKGLPQKGQFPSDHVCLVAEIGLLT